MSDIPAYIEFETASSSPQHLSDVDMGDCESHHEEHEEITQSRDPHDQYESSNITSQDLSDLKAMVQRLKSNPALIDGKVHELKNSLTTQKTSSTAATTMDGVAPTLLPEVTPPSLKKEVVNQSFVCGFPRLPVP